MILSASRRTDIPAFYAEWFAHRLKAGYLQTRNPFRPSQTKRLGLSPQSIEGIVFWTKDPLKFLPVLDELDAAGYAYFFQFTLTPYDRRLEPGLRDKEAIIQTFIDLSMRLGKERLLWRYDPIILDEELTISYHQQRFTALCEQLAEYTPQVTISFLDIYRKIAAKGFREASAEEMTELSEKLAGIASAYGLSIRACCEALDLSPYGIAKARCIDETILARQSGKEIVVAKDRNQRPGCGCAAALDIGAYNTCAHGCTYCYASLGPGAIARKLSRHDPLAERLT